VAAIVIVVLGGGIVATAAVLNNNASKLAATGVVCRGGTNPQNSHDILFLSAPARHPTQACAMELFQAGDGPRSPRSLIACASNQDGVEVYKRDGRADQCSRLGLRPLPGNYDAAVAHVTRLETALSALSVSANCIAPAKFNASVASILRRQGFAGWRVQYRTAQFSGQCGQFPSAALGFNAQAAVHGSTQTVEVTTGPSRSIYRITNALQRSMGPTRRCVTVPGLERQARDQMRALVGHPVKLTFGVFRDAREDVLGPHTQRLYNRGCAIFLFISPGQSSNVGPVSGTERPGFRVTILQHDAHQEEPGFKFEEHRR
jgi:hypothetical protein